MKNRSLLKTGLIGSGIAAVCCFTPVLVILFSAAGLTAVIAWLDVVLLPVLGFFLLLTLYAYWKLKTS